MATLFSAYTLEWATPNWKFVNSAYPGVVENVNAAISGEFWYLFYVRILLFLHSQRKLLVSPTKLRKVLKIDLCHPNFLSCPLSPQHRLTLLPNFHECPLPETAVSQRALKSLWPQQGGNEQALFSWKSFATSCGECRGCPVHSQFSLAAGPLLGNGKLTVLWSVNCPWLALCSLM